MDTFTETFNKIAEQVKKELGTDTSEPILESLFNIRISTALENTIKNDTIPANHQRDSKKNRGAFCNGLKSRTMADCGRRIIYLQ